MFEKEILARLKMNIKIIYLFLLLFSFESLASEFKVVTYNIAKGIFLNNQIGKIILKKSFRKNRKLKNTSIIGLQEICTNNNGQVHLIEQLLKAKNKKIYKYFDVESPGDTRKCAKGLAIFSNHPIIRSGTIRLPRIGSNRIAIWTDILINKEKNIRIYNIHLSNRNGKNFTPLSGRVQQGNYILNHANALLSESPHSPIIILGDFNSLNKLYNPWQSEPNIKNFKKNFWPSIKTFIPTMILPYKTDWIFYKNLQLDQSKISYLFLSDHFPVTAKFIF